MATGHGMIGGTRSDRLSRARGAGSTCDTPHPAPADADDDHVRPKRAEDVRAEHGAREGRAARADEGVDDPAKGGS